MLGHKLNSFQEQWQQELERRTHFELMRLKEFLAEANRRLSTDDIENEKLFYDVSYIEEIGVEKVAKMNAFNEMMREHMGIPAHQNPTHQNVPMELSVDVFLK
jgi:hypothetical protein